MKNRSRIALCHEWFTTFGGSDVCAARIAALLDPDAVYAFTFRDSLVRELLGDRRVDVPHSIGRWSVAKNHWQWLLPVMPLAWRNLDLSDFDLVVTSSHACTNAIRPPSNCIHISYCYTPMRYAWDPRGERGRLRPPVGWLWPVAAAPFRAADRRWAGGVDHFIAISRTVARRIGECYGRDAEVVYPPVDTDYFTPGEGDDRSDYFLAAGRIVAYKRFDVAVDAFSRMGLPLVVAGSGPDLDRIRKPAGPSIRFESSPTRERLRDLYRGARALVFPGVEDFGIVPVEAQACGTPVIAYRAGGATETVVDGATGLLYRDNSAAALIGAVHQFTDLSFDPKQVRAASERFSVRRFDEAFTRTLNQLSPNL